MTLEILFYFTFAAGQAGPQSAVWQENTQIRPEEIMTRLMWREPEKRRTELWCVSRVSGHGGWRCSLRALYGVQTGPETTITKSVSRQDSTASFTLQKPQHKERREQRNIHVRPVCTHTSLTKYGLPPCHIWECTSRRSQYKAGNPHWRNLTELKFKLTLSVHKTPTGNKQLLLFTLSDDLIHKDPPEII